MLIDTSRFLLWIFEIIWQNFIFRQIFYYLHFFWRISFQFLNRNVCTLESVAKSNPNRQIFVIFSSPTGFGFENNSSPIIEALQDYRNIHFRNVNWQKYAKDTPIEDWMQENHLLSSMHFQAHLSNYLRLITLYRFGGIHFDFDFIFHKRLDDLQPNFVSEERKDVLSNGAIAFESKDTGHEIVDMILRFVCFFVFFLAFLDFHLSNTCIFVPFSNFVLIRSLETWYQFHLPFSLLQRKCRKLWPVVSGVHWMDCNPSCSAKSMQANAKTRSIECSKVPCSQRGSTSYIFPYQKLETSARNKCNSRWRNIESDEQFHCNEYVQQSNIPAKNRQVSRTEECAASHGRTTLSDGAASIRRTLLKITFWNTFTHIGNIPLRLSYHEVYISENWKSKMKLISIVYFYFIRFRAQFYFRTERNWPRTDCWNTIRINIWLNRNMLFK